MIRLHRLPLSRDEMAALDKLGKDAEQLSEEDVRALFNKERGNALFQRVATVLKNMNEHHGHCHFCQVDRGNAIDHFHPINSDSSRAFDWDNYLWACSVCNSHEKNRKFPRDNQGRPLLLNPVEMDPYPFLPLNPDGKFLQFEIDPNETEDDVFQREVNNKTLETLALNDHQSLVTERKHAWKILADLLPEYPHAEQARKLEIKEICLDRPIVVAVLAFMHDTYLNHPSAETLIGRDLCETFSLAPEIKYWVNPLLRAKEEECLIMRELHGERVTHVEESMESFCLTFEGGAKVITADSKGPLCQGKKLLNAYNWKGQIVFHFRGVKLVGPPGEWVFQAGSSG